MSKEAPAPEENGFITDRHNASSDDIFFSASPIVMSLLIHRGVGRFSDFQTRVGPSWSIAIRNMFVTWLIVK
jgi:hypothetical protein